MQREAGSVRLCPTTSSLLAPDLPTLQLGVQELTAGRSERDLLNARWCQPSLRCGGCTVLLSTAEWRLLPCKPPNCRPTHHPYLSSLFPLHCSVVDVRVGTTEEQASGAHYRFGPTRFSVIPKAAVSWPAGGLGEMLWAGLASCKAL